MLCCTVNVTRNTGAASHDSYVFARTCPASLVPVCSQTLQRESTACAVSSASSRRHGSPPFYIWQRQQTNRKGKKRFNYLTEQQPSDCAETSYRVSNRSAVVFPKVRGDGDAKAMWVKLTVSESTNKNRQQKSYRLASRLPNQLKGLDSCDGFNVRTPSPISRHNTARRETNNEPSLHAAIHHSGSPPVVCLHARLANRSRISTPYPRPNLDRYLLSSCSTLGTAIKRGDATKQGRWLLLLSCSTLTYGSWLFNTVPWLARLAKTWPLKTNNGTKGEETFLPLWMCVSPAAARWKSLLIDLLLPYSIIFGNLHWFKVYIPFPL